MLRSWLKDSNPIPAPPWDVQGACASPLPRNNVIYGSTCWPHRISFISAPHPKNMVSSTRGLGPPGYHSHTEAVRVDRDWPLPNPDSCLCYSLKQSSWIHFPSPLPQPCSLRAIQAGGRNRISRPPLISLLPHYPFLKCLRTLPSSFSSSLEFPLNNTRQ